MMHWNDTTHIAHMMIFRNEKYILMWKKFWRLNSKEPASKGLLTHSYAGINPHCLPMWSLKITKYDHIFWFGAVFFCFALIEPTHSCVFCEGHNRLQIAIRMPASHLQFETEKQSNFEWCSLEEEKKLWIVCIFQVSTQQHVKRQRKHLFKVIARQVLLERRSHAAERGMKHFLSHPLHYTSVKRKQSAYQIVLRFHLF